MTIKVMSHDIVARTRWMNDQENKLTAMFSYFLVVNYDIVYSLKKKSCIKLSFNSSPNFSKFDHSVKSETC